MQSLLTSAPFDPLETSSQLCDEKIIRIHKMLPAHWTFSQMSHSKAQCFLDRHQNEITAHLSPYLFGCLSLISPQQSHFYISVYLAGGLWTQMRHLSPQQLAGNWFWDGNVNLNFFHLISSFTFDKKLKSYHITTHPTKNSYVRL